MDAWLPLLAALSLWIAPSSASPGDTSLLQRECLSSCRRAACSTEELRAQFAGAQPLFERLLGWSCVDECRYGCMWRTVAEFARRGRKTPQFHGKWPFARFLGMQEPASAFFSVLNLLPHLVMLGKVLKSPQEKTPMRAVWALYSLISINTWLWSAVFHARDTDLTEKMDYFCAFSCVVFSLLAFCLRQFGVGGRRRRFWNVRTVSATLACGGLFARHVHRMASVRFDYDYNMLVCIGVGAVNSLSWFAWAFANRKTQPRAARKCALAVLLINLSILLEVLDFAPWLWILDSHSLWHLSTSPLHLLWYSFVVEDCRYLEERQLEEEKRLL